MTVINFNDLSRGTIVDDEYSAQGVTISASGGSGKAMIFDTAKPTGGDDDLATDNLGGVLIISEDGKNKDPDDNGSGGKLNFKFDDPTSVQSLTFLDIEKGASVRFYNNDNELISETRIEPTADNGQRVVDFDTTGVSRMQVELPGSGAIDNLVFDGPSTSDGTITGTDGNDLIDTTYTGDPDGDMVDNNDAVLPGDVGDDDLIIAGAGDDTVRAGAGDDAVYGGAGNDSLFGDSGAALGGKDKLTLQWNEVASNGTKLGAEQTYSVDGMDVTVGFKVQDNGATGTIGSDKMYVEKDEGFDAKSGLELYGRGGDGGIDNTSTTTLTFKSANIAYGDAVQDVSFRINDIDFGTSKDNHLDIVTVRAYGADGAEIPVTITPESGAHSVNGNTVTAGVADASGVSPASQAGSVLYNIAGPVSRIEIDYDNGDVTDQRIDVTDVTFTTTASDAVEGGAGDDLIYGGSGDDYIEGNDGNDVLYGDNGPDGTAETIVDRESFGWEGRTDAEIDNGFTVNTGNVTVTYDRIQDTGKHVSSLADSTKLNVDGIDTGDLPIDTNSSLSSVTNGRGNEGAFSWEFSAPVDNVSFNINDIDGDGVVRVTAYDADGNKIPVTLTGGDRLKLKDTDTVAGADTADSKGGFADPTSADYNLNVSIAGPVSKIVVEHDQDGNNNSGINITEIFFDSTDGTPADNGVDGNDVIDGGAGDDLIYGEGGNDTLTGGTGDDSIYGGTGDDSIDAGQGNDYVKGGDGDDYINTSNTINPAFDYDYPGPNFPWLPVGDNDQFPNNDKDTVFGGAGNDFIITGDDADFIDGGSGNDFINAGIDDDTVLGGDGNDTIIGGQGEDIIEGNDGDDLIYGGLIEEVLDLPDAIDPAPDDNRDIIYGGAGNDTIFGRDDNDTLFGGTGNDYLDGGVDDDEIHGDDGDDKILGGQGDDLIYGGNGDDKIYGGTGNDNLFGGFGSDTFYGGDVGDVVTGGEDPDGKDVDVLDLRNNANVDFITYVDGDPEAGTVTFLDGSTMTFSEIENVIPCFTPGTTIATAKGERLVEELVEGDRIITRDNGIQEIAWVGHKEITGKQLVQNPHLRPILIKAGALGNGLPERDMMVSPNHRVLVVSDLTQLYFEENEVLAAAKHMVGSNGIHAVDVTRTTYVHFMFARHEVVLSNGAWTESFQPGDYSLKGIGDSQRQEIMELFPELNTTTGLEGYQSARKTLKKHEAKLLQK